MCRGQGWACPCGAGQGHGPLGYGPSRRCLSWKGTPYDRYRFPSVHSKVLPVVGVQGRICDVPGGPVEDTVWQLCWLPHCYVPGGPPKKWRHDVGHERVPPMIVTGSHRFIVRYCQLWGCKDGYVMCLGSCGGHSGAVLLASTLLCSWRAQKKKWMHDVGHERVPPDCYRVPPVHSKVLPVVGVQGRICDVPSGSCGGHSVAALLAFHIAMFLEVPKKEVETWCRSWKCTSYDCYRVPLVHSKVLPVVGVQGRICDVPGGPVGDTVWQLCWLSTLLCSWRAPRKKWRHDVGHERVPPMTVTGSYWFIVRYFQLWGCKELGRICDVPGVLWRIQCGSFAGFHIAMFLEGPKKEVDAWCRSWKGTPMTVTGSHRFVVQYFQLWGCKDRHVMCLGVLWRTQCGSFAGFHIAMSLEAPKKKWRHDVGHERVPPMTVTGSHRFIVQYFQLWGCKDGYVMCLGSCGGNSVAVLLASTLLCSWKPPIRSGGTMSVMKGYPLWLLQGPTGS